MLHYYELGFHRLMWCLPSKRCIYYLYTKAFGCNPPMDDTPTLALLMTTLTHQVLANHRVLAAGYARQPAEIEVRISEELKP